MPADAVGRQGCGKIGTAFSRSVERGSIRRIGCIRLFFEHASHHIAANRNLNFQHPSRIEAGDKQVLQLSFDRVAV